jgi:hypothetical protein
MQLVGPKKKASISSATRRHSPNANAREKNERSQVTEMKEQEGAGIALAKVQIEKPTGTMERRPGISGVYKNGGFEKGNDKNR